MTAIKRRSFQFVYKLVCTYTRYIIIIADTLRKQSIPYFPRKDRGALPLKLRDFLDDRLCGHPWFRSADRPWFDGTRLVIPVGKVPSITTDKFANKHQLTSPISSKRIHSTPAISSIYRTASRPNAPVRQFSVWWSPAKVCRSRRRPPVDLCRCDLQQNIRILYFGPSLRGA